MTIPFDHQALVGDIYDAAVDVDLWPRLPALLQCALGGGSAIVAVLGGPADVDAVTHGLPDGTTARYAAYYHRVNPFYGAASADGPSLRPLIGDDAVPLLRLRQTEFYHDFARGLEAVQVIGGVFPVAPGIVGEVGVHRGERNRRFGRRDLARVGRVLPHLQRAMQLRARLGAHPASAVGFAALDALAIGCVIANRGGRIVFANAAALALAAEGRVVLGGADRGIGAPGADDGRGLAALVADAALGGAGGAAILTGQDGGRVFALVSLLPARFAASPGHVLVMLRAADGVPPVDAPVLRQLFGLTPAEARLAHALLAGRALAEIGADQGVSENTLRSQLASVLRKTETASQRDLVRTLSLLPPCRGGAEP